MQNQSASKDEWHHLFEAVIRYKQLSPWKWMDNEDYFAVTDPETSEIGYCVVLGAGEMEFGLNVYLGPKANLYLKEITNPSESGYAGDSEEPAYSMKGISLGFEDREMLDKQDLALIRELGYKFRGAHAWPQFRSYEPGYMPWDLNGQQVRFLTVALEQAIYVAGELRKNDEFYYEHDETEDGIGEKRLHRVPETTAQGILWHNQWLNWYPEERLLEPYLYPNELQLHQLKKKLKRSKQIWESDFGYLPVAIEETEPPFYPRLLLWVDRADQLILEAGIVKKADCRQEYVEQLIHLLESTGLKPDRIAVATYKAYYALKSTTHILDIKLEQSPILDALFHAQMSIEQQFE